MDEEEAFAEFEETLFPDLAISFSELLWAYEYFLREEGPWRKLDYNARAVVNRYHEEARNTPAPEPSLSGAATRLESLFWKLSRGWDTATEQDRRAFTSWLRAKRTDPLLVAIQDLHQE
jgi:hypothetical protein